MNLLIIIGAFFTVFTPIGAASGYLLMLMGLISHRPLKEVKMSRLLIIILAALELARQFIPLPDFLILLLNNVLTALPVYLFYLIIKGEYMWTPRRFVSQYLKRYTLIGLVYLVAILTSSILNSLVLMQLIISSTFYTYLFYVLMSLYLKNPNRKRLSLPKKLFTR